MINVKIVLEKKKVKVYWKKSNESTKYNKNHRYCKPYLLIPAEFTFYSWYLRKTFYQLIV